MPRYISTKATRIMITDCNETLAIPAISSWRVSPPSIALALPEADDRVAVADGLARGDAHLGDRPGARGADHVVHLHRLERGHRLSALDAVALGHRHFEDHAGHRRVQRGSACRGDAMRRE